MEAAGAKLMDFSQPMDVTLLDQVVTTAFDASHPQVRHPVLRMLLIGLFCFAWWLLDLLACLVGRGRRVEYEQAGPLRGI